MKKSHNWITFVNPRNGKVRIEACSHCGTMNMPLTANIECTAVKSGRMANWTPLEESPRHRVA